jgi:hypothetical protein
MRSRNFWKIVNIVFLIGTAIGILQPAFLENKSLTQIIVSLLEPEATQGFLMRWLLLLGLLVTGYVFVIDRMYRSHPLTIIRNNFEVNFLSQDGSLVELNREQLLRANRPDGIFLKCERIVLAAAHV